MPYEKHDKVRVDLTEEQRRKAEETDEGNDVGFEAEELEQRIAPAQSPVLDTGIL
jgi:hypothetical protein